MATEVNQSSVARGEGTAVLRFGRVVQVAV